MYIKLNRNFLTVYNGKCKKNGLYLIVMTLSEVHIQRVLFEPEAPVLIDLVMLMRVTNIETCNAKRVYLAETTHGGNDRDLINLVKTFYINQ